MVSTSHSLDLADSVDESYNDLYHAVSHVLILGFESGEQVLDELGDETGSDCILLIVSVSFGGI
jgi:hypothetical protein